MKPENLVVPFSWNERRILIQDGVWYVPTDCEEFTFPGWESFFQNPHPIHIEYCSGNGAWIADRAEANPHCNWVAVEIKLKRVRKIWSKLKNKQLANLLAICGEGDNVTRRFLPSASVNEIYINFPDPWPKNRHAKNRIIQLPFLKELSRILKPKGTLTFVTDDVRYSEWMIKLVQQQTEFRSRLPEPFFTTSLEGYGASYFLQLWSEKGRSIRYHQFLKQCPDGILSA